MVTGGLDPVQRLLEEVGARSEAESSWLTDLQTFTTTHLGRLPAGHAPSPQDRPPTDVYGLTLRLVKKIQEFCVSHSLPLSYRPLSVSQLVSQQHLPCVSNLSWSTNQQRAWAQEAELTAPGRRALPRVNLLLIGCLMEGRGGEWTLRDESGSVHCECLSPSPLWLDRPVFLPHWNYIPQSECGRSQATGCLELIGPPVLLCAGPELGLAAADGEGAGPVGVREAVRLLGNRVKGQRLSVCGEVSSVCPLLVVSGSPFFFFTLRDADVSVPVLVQERGRLSWLPCLRVGLCVCVTSLRVCALRGWRGNNVLCATRRSELHTHCTHTHTAHHHDGATPPDTPRPVMSQPADGGGAEPEGDEGQSGARVKRSRIISYQGTVSEVVSEGAGLYLLDGTVGLCVAYQPARGRSLRVGDRVELHHVHFLFRPCPDLPPSMLCTCLRSTLTVSAFSRVGGATPGSAPSRCPGDGALPRLLLQTNRGVSDYLWACHLSSRLSRSLQQHQCVCLLSWSLMETLRGRRGRRDRDIYAEMLDRPHSCPLSQYQVDPSVPQSLSVSELCESLRSSCWSSLCLRSLLSPDGPTMTKSQINSALSWSCRTLTSDPQTGNSLRLRPLLLVGLLQFSSLDSEACLRLSDGTDSVCCVVTETSNGDEGRQRESYNTAWIGCLVCVSQFTMVTERFLQSDFPSYQHLDQDEFITHKHCRVYLQFSLDHVHILSPSVAMATHLRQKGAESAGDVIAEEAKDEEGVESQSKRRRNSAPRPCVSMVIRVEQKEGVTLKNAGAGPKEEGAGLRPSFSIRATVIGPVVSWGRDPRNEPMTDRETEGEGPHKVLLVFSGVCVRWFPLLQSGCFYRLVVVNSQDPSVLIGRGVSGQRWVELHTDAVLQVKSDWRFHTLTRPLLTCPQGLRPAVLSVSQVLNCSSELVCFQGLVSERICVSNRTTGHTRTHTGVRLTVCDQSGRSLQVYMDLSHTLYPPGLLPGNTLLLSAFQRRVSRTGSVYCSYLPVSCVGVVSVGGASSAPSPPPSMHLGSWALSRERRCIVGQVKGHVVCFLYLDLQWSCSVCGSKYTQSCSRTQCDATTSVFQSNAKVVVDDGTGEAHVWFSGVSVRSLLGLAETQWAGLQRSLRVKGHIRVYPRGRSLMSDGEDLVRDFLLCVCSSHVVCRPITFTCRERANQRPEEVKRFSRADRDFSTRLIGPLQLTCVHLSADSLSANH